MAGYGIRSVNLILQTCKCTQNDQLAMLCLTVWADYMITFTVFLIQHHYLVKYSGT